MGKSNYALNAPDSILAAARRAAKRDGVSPEGAKGAKGGGHERGGRC